MRQLKTISQRGQFATKACRGGAEMLCASVEIGAFVPLSGWEHITGLSDLAETASARWKIRCVGVAF